MTVGGWVGFVVIAVLVLCVGASIGGIISENVTGAIMGFLISFIVCIGVLNGMIWYYNNTASGQRAVKTQESNFNNGIKREVTVYDMEGDVIHKYTGTFDVEYDDDRILFDDENGLRHIIYYPTGTVIIDEVAQ